MTSIPTSETDKRKILGKVLEVATVLIFKSNTYTWEGQLKLQEDGAPIGLSLPGEIGRLVTAETDKSVSLKCEKNGIKMIWLLANTSQNHPNNDYVVAIKLSSYSEAVWKDTALASFKNFNRKVSKSQTLNQPSIDIWRMELV